MAREISFATRTVVSSQFLNDRQDIESPTAWGVVLVASSPTVLTVPVAADGTAAGSTAIIINGSPRLITAPATLALSGAAQTFDIYATVSGEVITDGFAVQAVTHGAAAPANSRLIGQAVWSGTQITGVTNLVNSVSGHNGAHAAGGNDPVTPAAIGTLTSAQITTLINQAIASSGGAAAANQVFPGDYKFSGQTADHGSNPAGGSAWLLLNTQGRQVSAATYPALAALYGSSGGNVTLPSPAGRSFIAVGSGGVDQNGVALTNRVAGQTGGEENHALLAAESGQNANATTGIENTPHTHGETMRMSPPYGPEGPDAGVVSYGSNATAANFPGGGMGYGGGIGYESANHAHAMNGRNADSKHNTVHPYIVQSCFVKT